ncbi:hypothetical protein [Streptoalloteichus hindustanus]|nr:hypothetical protein [Streptoalloteichus hindustanus]
MSDLGQPDLEMRLAVFEERVEQLARRLHDTRGEAAAAHRLATDAEHDAS